MASTSLPTAAEILSKFYAEETAYMSHPPDQRDFASGMAACLSPDFVCYQSPDLPWGGEWHGREGLKRWIDTMSSYWSALEVLEPKFYERVGEDGKGSVLVESVLRLQARGTGEVWQKPLVQIIKVDREQGWIESIQPFYWDVRGLRDALGL